MHAAWSAGLAAWVWVMVGVDKGRRRQVQCEAAGEDGGTAGSTSSAAAGRQRAHQERKRRPRSFEAARLVGVSRCGLACLGEFAMQHELVSVERQGCHVGRPDALYQTASVHGVSNPALHSISCPPGAPPRPRRIALATEARAAARCGVVEQLTVHVRSHSTPHS